MLITSGSPCFGEDGGPASSSPTRSSDVSGVQVRLNLSAACIDTHCRDRLVAALAGGFEHLLPLWPSYFLVDLAWKKATLIIDGLFCLLQCVRS